MFASILLSFLFTYFILVDCVRGQIQSNYGVEVEFPLLSFNKPVEIVTSGQNDGKLFVVEQPGIIRVFENSKNALDTQVFLDITGKVLFSGEQGLLGLTFDPNYSVNGYLYVNYVASNPTRTVIARYSVNPNNSTQVDENSEFILLEIAQPFSNHKGGQLAFGPDNYLYIATGDGGSEGDPLGNGQSCTTLLGKILRIDTNSPSLGKNYAIPADNPFAGNTLGYREEIFAYGLRNPWRFSFDLVTRQLWAGDVGQDTMEEIDSIEKGKNYGWNIMEGTLCYNPPTGCNQTGLVLPIYEYNHSLGNAIIGGFVYRGSVLVDVYGKYIYGDYGSGRIWALTMNDSISQTNMLLTDSNLQISSFGIDQNNELYICAFDGKIYRLTYTPIPELLTWTPLVLAAVVSIIVGTIIKKRRLIFSFSSSLCNP